MSAAVVECSVRVRRLQSMLFDMLMVPALRSIESVGFFDAFAAPTLYQDGDGDGENGENDGFLGGVEGGNDGGNLRGRRLSSLPSYLQYNSSQMEQSMNIATFFFLVILSCLIMLTFLACFTHSKSTSPIFSSARLHRLPNLVPPPLPKKKFFAWIWVCFYMNDEEIIKRVGYDALMFLRFHRLSLRCLIKISAFSFVVLLPVNYTGGEHKNQDDNGLGFIISDFSRFTMANMEEGSPRLWIHCFGVILLTIIMVRELLKEYSDFNVIRHRYLLSREPHLRTVLVCDIPNHLRSRRKISQYFHNMYKDCVSRVDICENIAYLEKLVEIRTEVLTKVERTTLEISKRENRKMKRKVRDGGSLNEYLNSKFKKVLGYTDEYYEKSLESQVAKLSEMNGLVAKEIKRRKRIMYHMDKMGSRKGQVSEDQVARYPQRRTAPRATSHASFHRVVLSTI